MSQIKAFDLAAFVVGFSEDLPTDVQRWHCDQANVEFQGHSQIGTHLLFEIILMMSETTQILGIVADCFAEFFGLVDGLAAEAAFIEMYFPLVMI